MTVLEQAAVLPEAADDQRPHRSLVAEHLGADPSGLGVVTRRFQEWQVVNVHMALESFVTAPGWTVRLVGLRVPRPEGLMAFVVRVSPLASLLAIDGVAFGAAEYVRMPSGPGEETACLVGGLLLLSGPEGPVVVWVRSEGRHGVALDVITASPAGSAAFLADLERRVAEHNPFRGRFLRLSTDLAGLQVAFEEKPTVSADEVILPAGVLESLQEHAIGISARAPRLLAAGRHLKRGLLLYGPPGTGKTHLVRYLASSRPDATVVVLTGSAMGLLDSVKQVLPSLLPAIVVFDDVDLIAEDRTLAAMAPRQLLFALLDAMDGMGDDGDVLFVCTSNRADTLERAIAARPGRIDQAVEVGLPDDDCRRRLLALYSRGMDVRLDHLDEVIRRTEGVTASFIKELLRRAWLRARAERSPTVTDVHVGRALDALLDPANPLTPALLGASAEAVARQHEGRGVGDAWCGI